MCFQHFKLTLTMNKNILWFQRLVVQLLLKNWLRLLIKQEQRLSLTVVLVKVMTKFVSKLPLLP
ncbi:Uncharacterised protein [Mycobacterium tuberculosis]|nr:Uncharacterised protein [Mycobacterium tuberculosis]